MRSRLLVLDVLRGVAIAGILLVNVPDMTRLGVDAAGADDGGTARTVLDLLVQTRFVPIFEVLFGVSMYLVISLARARGVSPWPPMLLRLGALLGIGLLHQLVYPGEVLTLYAIVGLVLLPVVVLVPRWLQLAAGLVLTVAVVAVAGSSTLQTPGLFLLGAAGAAYGVPALLERAGRPVWWVFGTALVVAAFALYRQVLEPGDPRFSTAGGQAGAVLAVVYVTGTALLLSGPARPVLAAVFEPVGRMALSNYVGASLVVVPAGYLLGLAGRADLGPCLLLAGAVLVVQSVASRAWLTRFRYGPLEWGWRAVTWRSVPALRRPERVGAGFG